MARYVSAKLKSNLSEDDEQMTDKKATDLRRVEDWERLAILEVRVDDHDEDIKALIKQGAEFSASMQKIVNTLQQIKWTMVGALGMIILTRPELIERMLAFIKVVLM